MQASLLNKSFSCEWKPVPQIQPSCNRTRSPFSSAFSPQSYNAKRKNIVTGIQYKFFVSNYHSQRTLKLSCIPCGSPVKLDSYTWLGVCIGVCCTGQFSVDSFSFSLSPDIGKCSNEYTLSFHSTLVNVSSFQVQSVS